MPSASATKAVQAIVWAGVANWELEKEKKAFICHKYMHTHGIGSIHLTCLSKYHKLVYIRHMQAAWGAVACSRAPQQCYQCTLLATCWSSKLITDPPVPKPSPKPPSSKPLTMWGAILAPRMVSALTADFD